MENAIVVKNLVKVFGDIHALRDCSFSVKEGEVFGLIGPNGAGKTTALRIVATLLKPTSGTVEVFGEHVTRNPEKIRFMFSYLPEDAGAYQNLSGYEYLRFMAGFYTDSREASEDMVKEGLRISGLGERLRDRVKSYSKGMLRRLLLARALMMVPRVAILDEPTSGLDIVHAYHVRQMIKEYVEKLGVTVLLSSHNMLEVEFLCDKVALINEGMVITQGRPGELRMRYSAENLEHVFMEATRLG